MIHRTIFVGDIHGCLEEAKELLDKCEATSKDWVIFVGDMVDRGPDSAGCIDLVMQTEARQGRPACVLGNHESKHLDYEAIRLRLGKLPARMHHSHVETREQLRPEHYDYMRRLPLFLRVPEHNIVAVHAGVYPGRTIEQQASPHLLHVQSICPPEERSLWPSRVPEAEKDKWRFWSTLWTGPERIVFGHSVLDRSLVDEHVVGIDGGACFGRELWAFIAPDDRIVSVKGRAKPPKHQRTLIQVHKEVRTFS